MSQATMPGYALHLASASPRRRDILAGLGLEFTWGGVDLAEERLAGETPAAMVARLARDKADAARRSGRDGVILGADTAVVLDDRVFGKPASESDAIAMLTALSGRAHEVYTGVAVAAGNDTDTVCCRTVVRFREIDSDEMRRYWHSGEPRDKAGAYAIQGLGGIFVESIEGSYSGVVGLPVYETATLLAAAGVDILR